MYANFIQTSLFNPRTLNVPIVLLFGATMIAMVWFGIAFQIRSEYSQARDGAKLELKNFARVFEEHVDRTVRELDKALLIARKQYRKALKTQSYAEAIRGPLPDPHLLSNTSFQLAMIDREGVLTRTTIGKNPPKPIDLSDRGHFKIHKKARPDTPFISVPVLGRRSGRWSVQLTRSVPGPYNRFDGVVVASMNPHHFKRFYGSIDFGKDGTVILAGLDGIVRATTGSKLLKLGSDITGTDLLKSGNGANGIYVGDVDGSGTTRLYALRRLENHPLFVAVGRPKSEVFAQASAHRFRYILSGAIVTLLILSAMFAAVRYQQWLQRAQNALTQSEAHAQQKSRELELTLEHMGQGIFMVDGDGAIVVTNKKAIDMLELPSEFLNGPITFDNVVDHMLDRGEYGADSRVGELVLMDRIRSLRNDLDVDYYERKRPDGCVLAESTQKLPDGGFVRTFTDITDRHRSAERIAHMARHDTLTNLANRTLFRERIDEAARNLKHGEGFCVMFLDLDHFKVVNDAQGHPFGDELLKSVGDRLRRSVRETDIVARFGGDEFAIALFGVNDPRLVALRAKDIVELLRKPFKIHDQQLSITVSVGVAVAPNDGLHSDELLKHADVALYKAKADGRGTFRIFVPEMAEQLTARRRLEEELSKAIEAGELELHYQPLTNASDQSVCGFEALIRWRHAERGLISPAEFIPVAEDTGLIIPIGEWVLNEACQQASNWPDHLKIAVNLSPVQFQCPTIVQQIESAIQRADIDPGRLELEITESVMMQHGEMTADKLRQIKELGAMIAMDDFGTGYSSLSYLRNFPFDKIKIDRSFVDALCTDDESASIVRAIISLANCLNVRTTAEGVETAEQLALLQTMACHEAQGFYFSKPLPASQLSSFLPAQPHLTLVETA